MQALESAGIYTMCVTLGPSREICETYGKLLFLFFHIFSIDLSLPVNGSLDRSNPAWSTNLLNLYINTIDAFAKYENVLAYNVGNEVVTSVAETAVAPFIKAAARDTKAYLYVYPPGLPVLLTHVFVSSRSKNLDILIGYAAINGDRTWIDPLANYLSCDSDETAIDLFGLND
jgi:hypothetical protein